MAVGLTLRPIDLFFFGNVKGRTRPVAKSRMGYIGKSYALPDKTIFPKLGPSNTEAAISAASPESPGKATQDADHVS
jgi:hypothetical protein